MNNNVDIRLLKNAMRQLLPSWITIMTLLTKLSISELSLKSSLMFMAQMKSFSQTLLTLKWTMIFLMLMMQTKTKTTRVKISLNWKLSSTKFPKT